MDNNTNNTIIDFEDVSTGYGNNIIHDHINLKIGRNDFIGLVGPNGAGKTTLFNVLTGQYKPDRGKVIFDGRNLYDLDTIGDKGFYYESIGRKKVMD